jgi:hypothetical protein
MQQLARTSAQIRRQGNVRKLNRSSPGRTMGKSTGTSVLSKPRSSAVGLTVADISVQSHRAAQNIRINAVRGKSSVPR